MYIGQMEFWGENLGSDKELDTLNTGGGKNGRGFGKEQTKVWPPLHQVHQACLLIY